eukprot:365831-Chlamydomonas_euryale.AAC.8
MEASLVSTLHPNAFICGAASRAITPLRLGVFDLCGVLCCCLLHCTSGIVLVYTRDRRGTWLPVAKFSGSGARPACIAGLSNGTLAVLAGEALVRCGAPAVRLCCQVSPLSGMMPPPPVRLCFQVSPLSGMPPPCQAVLPGEPPY